MDGPGAEAKYRPQWHARVHPSHKIPESPSQQRSLYLWIMFYIDRIENFFFTKCDSLIKILLVNQKLLFFFIRVISTTSEWRFKLEGIPYFYISASLFANKGPTNLEIICCILFLKYQKNRLSSSVLNKRSSPLIRYVQHNNRMN